VSKPSGTSSSGERLGRSEREALMLKAAGEAFAAHGFHGTSMDEIAGAAGITKPMLYRYFGSKEGLYAAYLRITGEELIEGMRTAESRGQSSEARLRAGLFAFLTYVAEHRAGWTVLHGETTGPADAQIASEVAELRRRIVGINTTVFGDEAFAHAFTGAAESLATWWVKQPQPSVHDAIETLMTIASASSTTSDRTA
jgi:AcrR family transcriptional regulator